MRKFIFFYFLLFAQIASAQQPLDFSRVVPTEGTTPRTFEGRLVQWAWYNQPENLAFKNNIEIAAKKEKMTWWEWLSDVNLSFNLNEGNLTKTEETNNIFFPRYNFGLNLNLGKILTRPAQSKIAQEELKIAKLEEQQQMLSVKSEVLSRYEDYLLAVEILKFKTQAAEDAESIYTLVLEQFENDKVDFKDYNTAATTYHAANENKAIAISDLNKAKIALEELIGFPIEKAITYRRKK